VKNLNNDLNISLAFTSIFEFMNEINKKMDLININQAKLIRKFISEIDQVFGFINFLYEEYLDKLKKINSKFNIRNLLREREKYR
jgi:cysteinyl-tRNA synthetase